MNVLAGLPRSPAPDISIVIPFYNRRHEVDQCLRAVMSQSVFAGVTFEVIAVDNGSTDGTLEALRSRSDITVITCNRRGPAAARNEGIRAAQAPIIAFTDSDCIPDEKWLAELTAPFADSDVLITGGQIVSKSVERGVEIYADSCRILNNEKFFTGAICFPPFFATANAAYRRDILEAVGGFDENLQVGEDADLCWRCLDLGGKMVYCPSAMVQHAHRNTFYGFFRQAVGYGKGSVAVFAKHRGRLGMKRRVAWENIVTLARLLIEIPARIVLCRDAYKRTSAMYDALWRTGFTWGCVKGCLKHRVIYL